MKSIIIVFCVLLTGAFLSYGIADAHSGRLDSKGGHYDHKTGEYHYHRGDNVAFNYSTDTKSVDTKPKIERETKPVIIGTPTGETTPRGFQIYEGPRGGHYHYSTSGKKVYEKKKR